MKRLEISHSLGAMDVLVSLARYNFVMRTVNNPDLKVLDFGCGSGYGSVALKEKFTDVTSFDIYPDGYAPEQIEVVSDLENLKKNQFDVVTCFEVIEHMDASAQDTLMSNLHTLTSAQGTLFISTVRKMTPPPTENRRLEHVKELTFEELLGLCQEKFHNVYTFGQIDQHITTFYKENHYHFVFICTGKK
jgi:2-polyprenyl-3-methyl-5-hydroxy-6-metoxy-1,4-benzoquinol methylase